MLDGQIVRTWQMGEFIIGLDGGRQAEVDHMGREIQVLGEPVASVPGEDIHLNIDIRLQKVATKAMEGESGAVIVTKPRTGEILALASFPDFDPNLFSGGIDLEIFKTSNFSLPIFSRSE